MSHGSGHGYGVSSPPSSSRPGPRRRETTDTNPFPSSSSLVSPTANRYSREDQGFWLGRKSTDTKESLEDADEDATTSRDPKAPPFGGLARSNTAGSAGFAASSALWGGSAGGGMSGGFGNFALPSAVGDKKAPAGRGESRLAHLLPKDSAETVGSKAGESSNAESSRSWRTRPRTDTDPFGGDDLLGSRSQGFEATGNAAIDMTMSGLSLSGDMAGSGHGRMSPAGTNPYRSPPVERGELDEQGEHGPDKPHGAGGLSEQSSAFGGGAARTFGSNVGVEGSDRSQTSSVGPKVYPPLGSLGGWPAGASGAGSGQDPRSAFGGAIGGSLFNPVSEVHSPGLSSFGGGVFGPASAGLPGASAIGSRSKLGSLFPPSMQAQMQEQESLDASSDLRHGNPLGAIGRSTSIGPHLRETDSPMRAGRGAFDELFPVTSEPGRAPALGLSSDAMPLNASMAQTPFSSAPTTGPGFGTLPATASDLPHLGSRLEMVMPDRMRWVYLDPQGQQQGPFSGLEMHDWFKANFFTADLRVRRVEDPDFEPLAQLIRRIGNSREPFLVPQVGIPHGPPSQTGPFSPTAAGGIIQPPLPGALPAFGRTLTAEEQNNLERRKQEEQMMLARQRELIQQQQMARFAGPGLQHQSSQHSLHSQQSYGSMTNAMPPLAPPTQLGMGPAFFDPSTGLTPQAPVPKAIGSGAELFRDVEIGQLSRPDRDAFAPVAGEASMTNVFQQGAAPAPSAPIAPIAPSAATSDLRAHLPSVDSLQDDKEGFKARLQEFNRLREDLDRETEERFSVPSETRDSSRQVSGQAPSSEARVETATAKTSKAEVDVKKAAEPQPSQAAAQQPQKPAVTTTAKQASPAATAGLPMPFPAPARFVKLSPWRPCPEMHCPVPVY